MQSLWDCQKSVLAQGESQGATLRSRHVLSVLGGLCTGLVLFLCTE
jgi:hypothetical protein